MRFVRLIFNWFWRYSLSTFVRGIYLHARRHEGFGTNIAHAKERAYHLLQVIYTFVHPIQVDEEFCPVHLFIVVIGEVIQQGHAVGFE